MEVTLGDVPLLSLQRFDCKDLKLQRLLSEKLLHQSVELSYNPLYSTGIQNVISKTVYNQKFVSLLGKMFKHMTY